MPYKQTIFADGEYYHVFNRGVEKRQIFLAKHDYTRFTNTLSHYLNPKNNLRFSFKKRQIIPLETTPDPQSIDLLCYVLMPNHFHLLVRQVSEKGITNLLSKITNSYTKYFNTKYKRVGPLFQGTFKAVRIEDDEQLIHVSRYIHLNPITSYLVGDLDNYQYSSYPEYTKKQLINICTKDEVLSKFKSPTDYKQFILDQVNYARELKNIEHLLLEKS